MTAFFCTALLQLIRRYTPTSCGTPEYPSLSGATQHGLWTSKEFRPQSGEAFRAHVISYAETVSVVTDRSEFDHVCKLRLGRYPEYASLSAPLLRADAVQRILPHPTSAGVILLRIAPEIISVLDCSKGFGHSDLITFSERDLDLHIKSLRHRWDDNVVAAPP
jgi:hypothetical protein